MHQPQALAGRWRWPAPCPGRLALVHAGRQGGGTVTIEVYSAPAAKGDPMIRLFDPNGHEVDYADDDGVRGSDAALMHEAAHTAPICWSCGMCIAVVNRIACGSAVSNCGQIFYAQHSDRKRTQRSGRHYALIGADVVWSLKSRGAGSSVYHRDHRVHSPHNRDRRPTSFSNCRMPTARPCKPAALILPSRSSCATTRSRRLHATSGEYIRHGGPRHRYRLIHLPVRAG